MEGELCKVRVTELHLSPGALAGRLAADECIDRVEHPIDLVLVTGEEHIAGAMMTRTRVTDVYGTVTVSSGNVDRHPEPRPARQRGLPADRASRRGRA